MTVEDFQRPEQDGRMHVMAAGVHHPLMDRSEFESGRLRNRKRIHIGPQHQEFTRLSTVDGCDNARFTWTFLIRNANTVQFPAYDPACRKFVKREFRICMDLMPDLNRMLFQFIC